MDNDNLPFKVKDTVSLRRGLGESGERVLIVSWGSVLGHPGARCPSCGYDRVRKKEEVNPELPNEVEKKCMNCGQDADEWMEKKERERERDRRIHELDDVPMKEKAHKEEHRRPR